MRVSGDIPVQSRCLPLISLYFMMRYFMIYLMIFFLWFHACKYSSLLFTSISFIWFVIAEQLRSRKYLVRFLKYISCHKQKSDEMRRNSELCSDPDQNEKKEIKSDHDLIDNSICILNFISFIFIFLSMFISYFIIWSIISTWKYFSKILLSWKTKWKNFYLEDF